jgi:uncharacterized protein YndB with AHSA1/START domain
MINDILTELRIERPASRVWDVMTGEGLVEQWLGCMGFKPNVGHIFYMQPDAAKRATGDASGATHCELLELDEPRTMRFSWFYPDMPKTEVEISLEEEGGSTRVSLVHRGWDQFDGDMIRQIRDQLAGGWSSHVLPSLKRVAEEG